MSKPKINGKEFLKALEAIEKVLWRKTRNQMNDTEKKISDITGDIIYKAYLTKKF